MDDTDLGDLVKGAAEMAADGDEENADAVLEDLQEAIREHERILKRQGELIRRLRSELKGVGRDRADE